MADDLFAESSPASGETKETQTPENQDAETQATVEEGEKQAETTPDSESTEPKPKGEGETEASSDDAGKSEKEFDLSKIPNEMLGKEAQKRIKKLNAKYKTERKAREAAESRQNTPPDEEKELIEPIKPDINNYSTMEEWNAAEKEWLEKHDEWVSEKTRREKIKADREKEVESERKKLLADLEKREAKTIERHPEYDRDEAHNIVQPDDAMSNFFVYSEIGPDILYDLSENPDEAERIRELPFWQKAEELINIKNRLLSQIKGTGKSSEEKPAPTYVDTKAAASAETKPLEDILWE